MARLILSIVLMVVLVAIVAFNGSFTTDLNLFGYRISAVPTVVVGLASFVLGVLYSFLLYLMSYFARRKRTRIAERQKTVKTQAVGLETREDQLDRREKQVKKRENVVETSGTDASAVKEPEEKQPKPVLGDAIRSFFGREAKRR